MIDAHVPATLAVATPLLNRNIGKTTTLAASARDHSPVQIRRVEWGYRRVPNARSGRHRTGYATTWPRQPLLRCESELERHCIHTLAADPQCIALATQPLTLWYRRLGRNVRYTPDILAIFFDPESESPSVRLFEVKPLSRLPKFKAMLALHAVALMQAVSMPLRVMTQMPGGAIAEVTP